MTANSRESQNKSLPSTQPEISDAAPASISSPENSSSTTNETRVRELGGPKGPEPTRFGDWERKGRCVDF